jgi:uncharacterized protein
MVFKMVFVEVVYASVVEQRMISLQVEEGSSIESVILRSGILEIFPEIDLLVQKVGVFGKSRKLDDCVRDGDRVEIYRGLLIDPKEARRLKAGGGF